MSFRFLFALSLITTASATSLFALSDAELTIPIAQGPYKPTMESLTNYHCPKWFRDAKFGIWAHWGPQAVPMEGDWYARNMYQQGSRQYEDHLKRWGHPSTNGWKDIIPMWKAEKWDPEKLMELYKKAGARYFVSMGTHHDNFFLWNSKLHNWNSVQMGPKRDVVGEWQAAAKKNGLPFGVSEHLGASFTWFQDSHKSDSKGPMAGVPYDGSNSNFWDLYHFKANTNDTDWYSNDPRWHQQWFDEIKELVENYKPDLLYSDGGVAFGTSNVVGLSQIANLYNLSAKVNGGKSQAIYNCKQVSDGRWVQDYERGVSGGIDPYPWQCDTSIGDWFYNRNWKYQPINWTVTMLVDIVSKNGNLLLNVVLRPDGTLDPEVEKMLHQLADWTAINGEAIYGTRPWLVYGEGVVKPKGGMFSEKFNYSAKDIRFTTKGKYFYATTLGWPSDRKITIRSLAKTDDSKQNHIQKVELLGHKGKLHFTQTKEGLSVEIPSDVKDSITCSLRIIGKNLVPVPVPEITVQVSPDAKGCFTLNPSSAKLHGSTIQVEERGGKENIGYWDNSEEWVSWQIKVDRPGTYRVFANIATIHDHPAYLVEIADQKITGSASQTSGWDNFQENQLGTVEINNKGVLTVAVRAKDKPSWKAINLNALRLEPVSK